MLPSLREFIVGILAVGMVLLALQPILRSWETFMNHLAGIEKGVTALAKPLRILEKENTFLQATHRSFCLQCHRILDEIGVSAPDKDVSADYDGQPAYYLRERLETLQTLFKSEPLLLVQLRNREEERKRIAETSLRTEGM